MRRLIFFTAVLFSSLSLASNEEKAFEAFLAIQKGVESKNYNSVKDLCSKNDENHFLCGYAYFVLGKTSALAFIKSLPTDKEGLYEFFKYDEFIGHQLYLHKMSNPYGSGLAFTYVDLLAVLSFSFPRESLNALISMYKYSEGYFGEYIEGKLIKVFFYERFNSEKDHIKNIFPDEIKSLDEAAMVEKNNKQKKP